MTVICMLVCNEQLYTLIYVPLTVVQQSDTKLLTNAEGSYSSVIFVIHYK